MSKSYISILICGLILAFAIGFFAGTTVFCKNPLKLATAPEEIDNRPEESQNYSAKNFKNDRFKRAIDSALGLSPKQIAKLDSFNQSNRFLRRDMREKIHAAEIRLHDILKSTVMDEAELQSVRAELLLLNEKRLDEKIKYIHFFKSVLTSEQITHFKDLQKEFQGKWPTPHFPEQCNKKDEMPPHVLHHKGPGNHGEARKPQNGF